MRTKGKSLARLAGQAPPRARAREDRPWARLHGRARLHVVWVESTNAFHLSSPVTVAVSNYSVHSVHHCCVGRDSQRSVCRGARVVAVLLCGWRLRSAFDIAARLFALALPPQ